MFLILFSKTEAEYVLKMFLQFWLISASRSYKLGSYKKKRVISYLFYVLIQSIHDFDSIPAKSTTNNTYHLQKN